MLDTLTKSSITIPTKYIILFWIIALILFTFYCLFRLWYLGAPARMDKFNNITTNPNAIQYIENLLAKDKITDIPACANVFDDNYGVRALGYRSCNDAFADYLSKGLDTSNNYGAPRSVADYCPATTKSPQYMQCMATLLEKYNSNTNMIQGVVNDMSTLVNKRLQDRSNVMNEIQLAVQPVPEVQEFETNSGLLGTADQSTDDKLYSASQYFQSKYGARVNVFADIPARNTIKNILVEGFANTSITIEPYIVSNFFGNYTAVRGQFLAFDNLQVSLNFDKESATATTTTTNRSSMPEIDLSSGSGSGSAGSSAGVGKVSLVITDNNTNGKIIYDVGNVDYYEKKKNAIVLDITKQIITNVNAADTRSLQQLLKLLGISIPTRLIISLEQTISDSGTERWTYKVMNIHMDTIMVMKKN